VFVTCNERSLTAQKACVLGSTIAKSTAGMFVTCNELSLAAQKACVLGSTIAKSTAGSHWFDTARISTYTAHASKRAELSYPRK
jgi:hypothetical protein